MIYRILIDQSFIYQDRVTQWEHAIPGRLGGIGGGLRIVRLHKNLTVSVAGLSDKMWQLGLPGPRLGNRRGRFYFTEVGWEQIGRVLAAEARKRGHVVRVVRQKNPPRSQILYRDTYQVAVLPPGRKKDDRARS